MPLQLDIVTPEKSIFSDVVENVYLPGADGEMGILPQHAGLVTALQAGVLRYLHNGQEVSLAIGSGFAEVTQKKVVVLTDMALGEAEIDDRGPIRLSGALQDITARRAIETEMAKFAHDAATRAAYNYLIPMTRYGTPEEIADAAVFLCASCKRWLETLESLGHES